MSLIELFERIKEIEPDAEWEVVLNLDLNVPIIFLDDDSEVKPDAVSE